MTKSKPETTVTAKSRRVTRRGAAGAKAASAFRTISEVASELGVQQHVLRFWESKFSHVKPLKRGGGRRYYRPEDVQLLKGIHHMLYDEGYTIKGVQKILQNNRGKLPEQNTTVDVKKPQLETAIVSNTSMASEVKSITEDEVEKRALVLAEKMTASLKNNYKQQIKILLGDLKQIKNLMSL